MSTSSGSRLDAALTAIALDTVWHDSVPKAAVPKKDGPAPDWSGVDMRPVPAGPGHGYLKEVEARNAGKGRS